MPELALAEETNSQPGSCFSQADLQGIYHQPLLDLVYQAHSVHRNNHDPHQIQRCTLLSIKTGGCPENCSYCPQSAHYETGVDSEKLMSVDSVREHALKAKTAGASRFCMGAAWRNIKNGKQFDQVLEMVQAVAAEGLEVCATLGMLDAEQASALRKAGLCAYNHNLDTSPEYYSEIITTRTYQDRLDTLEHVANAGINVCSGGIIGMGETNADRCSMLRILANLNPQPESVPINVLVRTEGTPLAEVDELDPLDLIRMVATARIVLPKSRIRLSAGRTSLSREAQAFCFMAGANSIFFGEKLLTSPNPDESDDNQLLKDLGFSLTPLPEPACQTTHS